MKSGVSSGGLDLQIWNSNRTAQAVLRNQYDYPTGREKSPSLICLVRKSIRI